MPDRRPSLPASLRRDVEHIVGAPHVLVDGDERRSYEVDWTGRFRGETPAVVRPGTAEEVAAVLDLCRREALAVVPQGGNTGLVGGSVPLAGELVLSLRRLRDLGEVDAAAGQVTVGAGVTLAELRAHAAAHGLDYAVDLAARDSATVGGTVATNAGGLRFLRHGGTRQQVRGIEAVLANGGVVRHLGGLLKDNTGYDLASLVCGSEGTLALVTQARLALVPVLPHRVVALVAFASAPAAVEAVGAWHRDLPILDAAELFLDAGLALVCRAFDRPRPFAQPAPVYVLVEASAAEDPTDALAARIESAGGVVDVAVATDQRDAARLWWYREEHTAAINALGPPRKLDVTVPFTVLDRFLEEVPSLVSSVAPGSATWLFGHVGDGNIHVNVTGAPEESGDDVDEAVLTFVASLGGSISAEHGIGTAKRRWLHLNRSPVELDAFRAIKHALDPDGILNPNVLLP